MSPDSLSPSLGERDVQRLKIIQADGFVVVARSQTGMMPPYKFSYVYEHFTVLGDALDMHDDYVNGEYHGMSVVGIFPVRFGLPFGPAMDPDALSIAVRKTEARS